MVDNWAWARGRMCYQHNVFSCHEESPSMSTESSHLSRSDWCYQGGAVTGKLRRGDCVVTVRLRSFCLMHRHADTADRRRHSTPASPWKRINELTALGRGMVVLYNKRLHLVQSLSDSALSCAHAAVLLDSMLTPRAIHLKSGNSPLQLEMLWETFYFCEEQANLEFVSDFRHRCDYRLKF
eukprot:3652946-Amphidinium_carterae.1